MPVSPKSFSAKMNICVFCASSETIAEAYKTIARQFGYAIAQRGHTLVYGGGNVGLMGELARAVHQENGHVIGVIPESLKLKERAYTHADRLVVTPDMRARKAAMDELADVFVALPGGFGTLEEVTEAITARYLGFHHKPIFFLNTRQFYNPLFELFAHFSREGFSQPQHAVAFEAVETLDELWTRLKH